MGIPVGVVVVTAVTTVPAAFRCVIVIVAKPIFYHHCIGAIFVLFKAHASLTFVIPAKVAIVAAVSTIPVTMLNIVDIITKAITNILYAEINTNVNENYSKITNSM